MRNELQCLYSAPVDSHYIVTEVPNIKILDSLGIFPGTVLHKKQRYKFGGPVLIDLSTREIALGKDIAASIKVKEAKCDGMPCCKRK